MLDPRSSQAEAISNLFNITMAIALVILALVTTLVLICIFRFRARPGQAVPRPIFGLTKLEIAWTAGPLLILAFLFIMVIITTRTADPTPSAEAQQQPDIELIGHQWWWEVRYPQAKVTTANEIHIPVGKQMLMKLNSEECDTQLLGAAVGPQGRPHAWSPYLPEPGNAQGRGLRWGLRRVLWN